MRLKFNILMATWSFLKINVKIRKNCIIIHSLKLFIVFMNDWCTCDVFKSEMRKYFHDHFYVLLWLIWGIFKLRILNLKNKIRVSALKIV
jgi:hypothetical protein